MEYDADKVEIFIDPATKEGDDSWYVDVIYDKKTKTTTVVGFGRVFDGKTKNTQVRPA